MDPHHQEVWMRIWSRPFSRDENRFDIEREGETVRWRKIRSLILNKFGTFLGLKVIEIGSGRGIYSLLASLEGAQISLLDNNEVALQRAKEFFCEWNQDFKGIVADAFNIPKEWWGTFDVAMSYGLAEHFRYPERLEIFRSHLQLLKPGGLLIVSVPNAAFFPYRVGKYLLEILHKWELGLEIPFSRGELKTIAKELGLRNWRIIGSGILDDTLNFWLTQRLIHLPGLFWEKLCRMISLKKNKSILPLKERNRHFSVNPRSPLDDYLGYALVLVGET